jgi:hypothetical protein
LEFQVFTFLGSWFWCFALAYNLLHRFDAVIVLAIVAAGGWFTWSRWRIRLRDEPQ